uniref:Uncharacterized protein n=1 Tax=Cacopsylla melanoneura TaxID=428564 RepID=A0A8D8Z8U7_9HEMI
MFIFKGVFYCVFEHTVKHKQNFLTFLVQTFPQASNSSSSSSESVTMGLNPPNNCGLNCSKLKSLGFTVVSDSVTFSSGYSRDMFPITRQPWFSGFDRLGWKGAWKSWVSTPPVGCFSWCSTVPFS